MNPIELIIGLVVLNVAAVRADWRARRIARQKQVTRNTERKRRCPKLERG